MLLGLCLLLASSLFFLSLLFYYYFKLPSSPPVYFFENLLIGHRGCNFLKHLESEKREIGIPENTLQAFRYAIEHGVDGVEFDLTLSKDGVAVIMHDSTTKRMCEQLHDISENVKDCTVEELKKLKFKNDKFDQKIPTFQEVLDLTQKEYGKKYKMMVEIKSSSDTKKLAELVAKSFDEYDLFETAVVGSFNPLSLYYVRKFNPRICTLLLVKGPHLGTFPNNPMGPLIDRLLWLSEIFWLPSFVGSGVIGFDRNLLQENNFDIDLWQRSGYILNCWTVNSETEKLALQKKRVTVTTDFLFPK